MCTNTVLAMVLPKLTFAEFKSAYDLQKCHFSDKLGIYDWHMQYLQLVSHTFGHLI